MIFPNAVNTQNLNASTLPQLYNNTPISLPFTYSGNFINYRDSSWLKLNVCELFLKNGCPNVDNCSLAHPPSTIKIENTKVTVCYDFIKKRDCKHGNCKYYHPHDALASAILRKGDDTKKNANSLSNLGLTMGLRSPLQIPRSQDLLHMQPQHLLSSHVNNAVNIAAEQQLKTKMEVMRQLNAASAPPAWLSGLSVTNGPVVPTLSDPANVSLHPLLPLVSVNNPAINPMGSILPQYSGSLRPGMADPRLSGVKRPASDGLGPFLNDASSGVKKVKPEDEQPQGVPVHSSPAVSHYYPQATFIPSSQTNLTSVSGPSMTTAFNLLQSNPLQTSSLMGYPQLGSFNVNNLLLQSLLSNHQSMATGHPNLESMMAFSGQKLYAPIGAYPTINLGQMPLINPLYYQQLIQNSLSGNHQILYPGPINLGDLQQRTVEETSVAFINDKGTILETLPVCKDFLQSKCKRNQSCNYVHLLDPNVEIKDCKLTVCKNALKGQCHRPVCKFYHIPTYQLQKLGFHNQPQ